MVEASLPAASPTTADLPSMGPPSVPHIPPITLEEAVLRARARILRRNKRASRALIVSLCVLSFPLIQASIGLFPSDPMVKVSLSDYLYFLAVWADAVLLALGIYRILGDRVTIAYPVLAAGALAIVFYVYTLATVIPNVMAKINTGFADWPSLVLAGVVPVCGIFAGAMAMLAGATAMPRAARVAEPA